MSASRFCLAVSGPGTPSRKSSAAPRIDVRGDRSSCDTVAKNSRRVSSTRRSWPIIELNDRVSDPISSRRVTTIGSRNLPVATAAAAADRSSRERVIRWERNAAPSSATPTAAPSATSIQVHMRPSTRALSAYRKDARMGGRHQGAQPFLDPLGQQARVDIGQADGAEVIAHLYERTLPGDDAAIPIERGAGLAQVELLQAALRVFDQALEIVGDLRRPLGPRRRVGRITEGHRSEER